MGFQPFNLRFLEPSLEIVEMGGCLWDTLGTVPDAPGHYLFSVGAADTTCVVYLSLTENLSMVTKGRLPLGVPDPRNAMSCRSTPSRRGRESTA